MKKIVRRKVCRPLKSSVFEKVFNELEENLFGDILMQSFFKVPEYHLARGT